MPAYPCGWPTHLPLTSSVGSDGQQNTFSPVVPFAPGWGMEVGMTVDVLRAGLTVEEVDVELTHRATGTDLAGQLHRASQLKDVTRALAARGLLKSLRRGLR